MPSDGRDGIGESLGLFLSEWIEDQLLLQFAVSRRYRIEHVIGKDFLDAESHPDIRFQADTVTSDGHGYQGTGTATVNGQPAPIHMVVNDVLFTDTTGAFSATAATAVVDRNAIGVDKMPTLVIGQNLELTVNAKVERLS